MVSHYSIHTGVHSNFNNLCRHKKSPERAACPVFFDSGKDTNFLLFSFVFFEKYLPLQSLSIFINMETLVIEPKTKADAQLLHDFSKRIGARIIDTNELLEDMIMCRLIEEGLKTPSVGMDEVKKALRR